MSLDAHAKMFASRQAQKAVPKRLPQRQDSLAAQLHTLVEMATRAGCYDAADWLKKQVTKG